MQGMAAAVEKLTAPFTPLLTACRSYAFISNALPAAFPGTPFALAALLAVIAYLLLREPS